MFANAGCCGFRSDSSNVVWTGFGRKTPVIVFKVEGVMQKKPDLKTIGGTVASSSLLRKTHVAETVISIAC